MSTKKATLYINPTVHKMLKVKAALADMTISAVTNDLLEAYFESMDEKLIKELKAAQKEADTGQGVPLEEAFK